MIKSRGPTGKKPGKQKVEGLDDIKRMKKEADALEKIKKRGPRPVGMFGIQPIVKTKFNPFLYTWVVSPGRDQRHGNVSGWPPAHPYVQELFEGAMRKWTTQDADS